MFVLAATVASAQTGRTTDPKAGVGEKYWVEFSATWWQPALDGLVRSDSLGLIGSQIDLVSDLAFKNSSHRDIRLVLRPGKKHRFRFQYTPLGFTGDSLLSRDIAFAGQIYPVSLPVQSALTWNVMRFGYEWDFFYRPRGFVGVLLEVRKTDMTAGIDSIIGSGEIFANAPLPAIGLVGRAYPVRHVALNFEVSGLTLSDLIPDIEFKTLDYEFSATYNVTGNFGVSGGFRRMNTRLVFDTDMGELNFRGLWFGGVVRY